MTISRQAAIDALPVRAKDHLIRALRALELARNENLRCYLEEFPMDNSLPHITALARYAEQHTALSDGIERLVDDLLAGKPVPKVPHVANDD